MQDLLFLDISEEAEELSLALMKDALLPQKASEDALHIAISACNGMDYLLTWNCKHLANAVIVRKVYQYLENLDYQPPMICTPAELREK